MLPISFIFCTIWRKMSMEQKKLHCEPTDKHNIGHAAVMLKWYFSNFLKNVTYLYSWNGRVKEELKIKRVYFWTAYSDCWGISQHTDFWSLWQEEKNMVIPYQLSHMRRGSTVHWMFISKSNLNTSSAEVQLPNWTSVLSLLNAGS